MTKIFNGESLAATIQKKVAKQVMELPSKPRLDVILIGNDSASEIYVTKKQEACQNVGIISKIHHLADIVPEQDLLDLINDLNRNPDVHAILVQFPLPKHINKVKVMNIIAPEKDVDGFNPVNIGNMLLGNEALVACTPKGVIKILHESGINVKGKNIVIVNASNIVGKPLATMLTNRKATVTICHSKTRNLKKHTSEADILIAATGVVGIIKPDMVKQDAIVIDIGICKKESKVCGDINPIVREKTALITPVPGGVGPVTVACLLENTITCYKNQTNKSINTF